LWPRLKRYVEDGHLKIDNNLIKNSIRPVAIGRKNYLFAGSHDGARNAAVIYSLLATCKLNDIEALEWLKNALDTIPD
jgi:transposase